MFDDDGLPLYRDYIPGEKLPKGYSILPFFPGYTFENGVSTYLDEKIGEGNIGGVLQKRAALLTVGGTVNVNGMGAAGNGILPQAGLTGSDWKLLA